ncbi:MAG: RNA polymerase sigma factor [Bacteroidales bacterium]
MHASTDEKILELIRKKETKNYGFDLLMKKYQVRVYHHIRRLLKNHQDTDDVMQDTFIKVWDNLDTFREDSGIFTWIYRIASNEALSFLRKRKIRRMLSLGVDTGSKDEPFSTQDRDGEEIYHKLMKAVARLPAKQQLVFNMKYFDEMKYTEISRVLGTSVGALKASYHHAIRKIKENIQED